MTDFNNPNQQSPQPNQERPPVDSGRPAVAAAPARTMIIIGGVIAAVAVILFTYVGGEEEIPKKDFEQKTEVAAIAASQAPLPPPPPPPPAPPPPPPPPPPSVPTGDLSKKTGEFEFQDVDPEQRKARIRSNMVVLNGASALMPKSKDQTPKQGPIASEDPNSQFATEAMASIADKAEAGKVGNMRSILAQGKLIDAILETAVNTDLPGTLRAIVSNDIYAEMGKAVLVPRGSRLIGVYNTNIKRGQKRVFIIWQRMIRPDGIDMDLGSYGIDNLGRSGIEGIVDSKFYEIFSSAILTSTLTLGSAFAIEKAVGKENSTTSSRTFTDGSQERTGTPTAQAASQLVGNFGSSTSSLIDDYFDLRPTINIEQGTPVKVFVNRDLVFPDLATSSVNFIQ